jgi:hypothetical protein
MSSVGFFFPKRKSGRGRARVTAVLMSSAARMVAHSGHRQAASGIDCQKKNAKTWILLFCDEKSQERKYLFLVISCYIPRCIIVRYKNDTIAKIMKTSAPNMTFRRDLSG